MTKLYHCATCNLIHEEHELVPFGEWNPDAGRTLNYLGCPQCGEADAIGDAAACASCAVEIPANDIVDGTDLCETCAGIEFAEEHHA